MANSTTAISRNEKTSAFASLKESLIKTSEVLVIGGFAAIEPTTGLLENMDTTAGLIPVGIVKKASDGDNSATGLTGDGTKKAITETGQVVLNVSVTGASAITDIFKPVYATDNQTLTLTSQSTSLPVGFVKKWNATTYCDVQLYPLSESVGASSSSNSTQLEIQLGYLSAQSMGGTAAATFFSFIAPTRMTLNTLKAMPQIDDAAAAGSQTLNLAIGGVDVTGSLVLAYTDCDALADLGTAVTASLTATNIAEKGDTVILEMAASGTGFTDNTAAGFNMSILATALPG